MIEMQQDRAALWTPSTGRFGITGSRRWPVRYNHMVYEAIASAILRIEEAGLEPRLAEGCCKQGVDHVAEAAWRRLRRCEPDHFPALWGLCEPSCPPTPHRKWHKGKNAFYCPLAGHNRNQRIVDSGIDVLLAFPYGPSPGTRDCMRRAQTAGVPIVQVPELV